MNDASIMLFDSESIQPRDRFQLRQADRMIQINWIPEDQCYELRCAVMLPQTRVQVFEFFSDAFQLEQITPPWLNFKILTPAPIDLKEGCLIDYQIRLHGIPIRWRTEISSWDPPYSFTDRQLRGPYRLWEHLHTFEEIDGGTVTTDCVRYKAMGGRFANWLLVERDLRRIFEYRRQRMLELFPAIEKRATETSAVEAQVVDAVR